MNRATSRARLPAGLGAFAVSAPGDAQSDAALDLRQAIYFRRSTLAPAPAGGAAGTCSAASASSCTTSPVRVTIEQRWFAHRTLPSVLVMEVEVLAPKTAPTADAAASFGRTCSTFLKLSQAENAARNSSDINFTASASSDRGVRVSLGWTQVAETTNLTQVGILSSDLTSSTGSFVNGEWQRGPATLWEMTPGTTRTFLTVVRTSLETPSAGLPAALRTDYQSALALAANGTLQSTHTKQWASSLWSAGVEIGGRRDAAIAINSSVRCHHDPLLLRAFM